MMINLITITSSFPSNSKDHSGIFILRLVEQLREISNSVIVPYNGPLKDIKHYRKYNIHFARFSPSSKIISNMNYNGGMPVFFSKKPWMIILYPLILASMYMQARKLINNYTIIHAHWLPNGIVGLLAKLLRKNVGFIVTIRGADATLIGKPIIDKFYGWILKKSDAITTVSRAISEKILDNHDMKEKVFFIPNGVFLPSIKVYDNSKPFRIVFVGSLIKRKGVSLVLNSLNKITKHDVFFNIIGDGPERLSLEALSKELTLDHIVSFKGSCQPNEIQNNISINHCLVLPAYSEGTPNVVKEAMACARPVIATNVGGIPELIEHGVNGLLFEPGDYKTLSKHITYLAENGDTAQAMGMKGREFIIDQGLTWENMASQYMELYKSIFARA